jgi:hypothetical protein
MFLLLGWHQRRFGQHGARRLEVAHVRHRQGIGLARRSGCHSLHGNFLFIIISKPLKQLFEAYHFKF